MRSEEKNQHFYWRYKATQVLVVFFVLYALADVTVLQAYCGNETVGIPPYARQLQVKKETNKRVKADAYPSIVLDASGQSEQEQIPDLPSPEEECFCCCSHTLLGFSPVKSISAEILSANESRSNFFSKHFHSDTHLHQLYQPPKFS